MKSSETPKSLEAIANSIKVNDSYAKFYAKTVGKHGWLNDILTESYDGLCKAISLRSIKHDYLPYSKAAVVVDHAVLTVSAIYDKRIEQLEHRIYELECGNGPGYTDS